MRTKERRRRAANKAARIAAANAPDRIQGLRSLISEQFEFQAERGVRRLHESADIRRLRAEIAVLENPVPTADQSEVDF